MAKIMYNDENMWNMCVMKSINNNLSRKKK